MSRTPPTDPPAPDSPDERGRPWNHVDWQEVFSDYAAEREAHLTQLVRAAVREELRILASYFPAAGPGLRQVSRDYLGPDWRRPPRDGA